MREVPTVIGAQGFMNRMLVAVKQYNGTCLTAPLDDLESCERRLALKQVKVNYSIVSSRFGLNGSAVDSWYTFTRGVLHGNGDGIKREARKEILLVEGI